MTDEQQPINPEQNGECWADPFQKGSPLDGTLQKAIDDAAGRPADMEIPEAIPHTELVEDMEAAAHGARKFHARFADAEVQKQLDRLTAPRALWCVTIHSVIPGDIGDDGRLMLRHWMKRSDNMPYDDLVKCVAGMADMIAKVIPLEEIGNCLKAVTERMTDVFNQRRKAAELGLFGAANAAPNTFADEED